MTLEEGQAVESVDAGTDMMVQTNSCDVPMLTGRVEEQNWMKLPVESIRQDDPGPIG